MIKWIYDLGILIVKFVLPVILSFLVIYYGFFYKEKNKNESICSDDYYRVINIPNSITLIGIILIPIGIYFFIKRDFLLMVIFFLLSGISDVLDGWLARTLNQKTYIGKIIDPVRDRILLLGAFYILFDIIAKNNSSLILFILLLVVEICISCIGISYSNVIKVHCIGKMRQAIHLLFIFLLFLNQFNLIFWRYLIIKNSNYLQVVFLMLFFSVLSLIVYWLKVKNNGHS